MSKSQFSAAAGVVCLLLTAFLVVQSTTGDGGASRGMAVISFFLTVIFGVGAFTANLRPRVQDPEVDELEAAFRADSFEPGK